jgi:FAD/FMN-containing dehydrogenase
MIRYRSWGGGVAKAERSVDLDASLVLDGTHAPYLVHGLGRSYGDVALLDHGTMINGRAMQRLISFDIETGVLQCEAGCDLGTILEQVLPHGWTMPVIPGTRFVTVGGSIANDIHGKNHHRRGSFGRHVRWFRLLRSDGTVHMCSSTENAALFQATIGGLGLTGVILDAEIQLVRAASPMIDAIDRKTRDLAHTLAALQECDVDHEFTVAWVDLLCSRRHRGRGVVSGGDHASASTAVASSRIFSTPKFGSLTPAARPFMIPSAVRVGNAVRYHGRSTEARHTISFQTFFHPLDAVDNWNAAYGPRGFHQYQFVIPFSGGEQILNTIFDTLEHHNVPIYLAVIKRFGNHPSPGMLSFPHEGITVAMDVPEQGHRTREALDRCDEIVMSASGRIYAAKDRRVSGATFRAMYPNYTTFFEHLDPRMSSAWWERINGAQS